MAPSGEIQRLEDRIAWLEQIENTVSIGAGIALTIPVAVWCVLTGWIPVYICLVPFFLGSIASKLAFSIKESQIAARVRQMRSLPEARVIRDGDRVP